jgi:hypothetical protein
MTTKRFVGTCAAAFVVSQILAIAVHGFILRNDYLPYYGTLLRPIEGDGAWQMILLPVAHLSFVIALVWMYSRLAIDGSWVKQGLTIGALGFFIGQMPLWLLWYAEQPWPGSLVIKQLPLELVSALLIGIVVAGVARRRAVHGGV